jgi:hypothetical protein
MIARSWYGWTRPENAYRNELLAARQVLLSFEPLTGYEGAYLLREDRESETEFVTLALFEDSQAVRRFAGGDYQSGVVPIEARQLLARFDERSKHYEIVLTPS